LLFPADIYHLRMFDHILTSRPPILCVHFILSLYLGTPNGELNYHMYIKFSPVNHSDSERLERPLSQARNTYISCFIARGVHRKCIGFSQYVVCKMFLLYGTTFARNYRVIGWSFTPIRMIHLMKPLDFDYI